MDAEEICLRSMLRRIFLTHVVVRVCFTYSFFHPSNVLFYFHRPPPSLYVRTYTGPLQSRFDPLSDLLSSLTSRSSSGSPPFFRGGGGGGGGGGNDDESSPKSPPQRRMIRYYRKGGKRANGPPLSLDSSDSACSRFGFKYGQTVMVLYTYTNILCLCYYNNSLCCVLQTCDNRRATVLGEMDGNLFFHCQGDNGASTWPTLKSPSDFSARGFRLDTTQSHMLYGTNSGDEMKFNITKEACESFGFLFGDRVKVESAV